MEHKKPTKLSELVNSLEMASDESVLRIDLQEGEVVMVDRYTIGAIEDGNTEDLDEKDDEVKVARAIVEDAVDRFIPAPDKFDYHEYHQMERFIGTIEDASVADQLWRAIKGKGAFRYFKDTAQRLGLLDAWYQFRDESMKEFVIEWADANEVPYIDDLKNRKKR